MAIQSINPFTGNLIKEYKTHSSTEINDIIEKTNLAWFKLKETSFDERKIWMKNIATLLLSKKEEFAKLMALEMGKPLKDGIGEVEKCASVCEYYANNAEEFLQDEIVETEASKSLISLQPIGVVLAIMPWNFPFWQVFRFVAPALMAGNAGLLKHASNVTGCALAIEEIVKKSGFPENCFNLIIVSGSKTDQIINHKHVKAVTLTGSTEAGKKVAALAGSLIKKTVLELGGSDPYIILKDADLELAAQTCVNSRLINNGQSCIAAKRFIVEKSVAEEFTALVKSKMELKKYGDPLVDTSDLGTMARIDLRDELHKQVLECVEKGAECILGGFIPKEKGAFYPPTILLNVKKGMPGYDDEMFGPVASIIIADNEDAAVDIANETIFGLGSALFTNNLEKAELIAKEKIQAGSCFINNLVKSDPRLPFGGINQSGYGRELAHYGIKEFVNIKTVYIK